MQKYYSLEKIKKIGATYNVIFGKRSNGKSYAVLEEIIKNYFKNKKQSAIIRRVDEDFKSNRGMNMFTALVNNGVVERYSDGNFTGVVYYNRAWYFANYDDDAKKWIRAEEPFCFGFSLNSMEHDKSTSYPRVTIILFDEFISRYTYLNDEFILFQNTLSTIIRDRIDVIIYMLGNSINVYCPYFNEMGIKHVRDMKPGDIDVYTYGESNELTVAVEYCENNTRTKSGEKYFAFDNPKLNMITNGDWELTIYPHIPEKYSPRDIVFRCYIVFDEDKYCMDIVSTTKLWGAIHPQTRDIDYDRDFILTTTDDPRYNICSNISKSTLKWARSIRALFLNNKVFYSDNMVGCAIDNFLKTCTKKS